MAENDKRGTNPLILISLLGLLAVMLIIQRESIAIAFAWLSAPAWMSTPVVLGAIVLSALNFLVADKKGYSPIASVLLGLVVSPVVVWMYLAAVPSQKPIAAVEQGDFKKRYGG